VIKRARQEIRQTTQRLLLLPQLVGSVRNWPTVLGARIGLTKSAVIRFRDGSVWHLLDVRSGLATLRDVYLERVYDTRFKLDRKGTILDLGANIGLFTVLAAKSLVPEGRVVAVEPNPCVAEVLKRNLKENSLTNVELIEAAAFTEDGEARLQLASHSLGATIIVRDVAAVTLVVPTISLSTLVNRIGTIDLLKVDIEGAEWSIFLDSQPDTWKDIKRIAMEFHLDAAGARTLSELTRHLSHVGYSNIQIHHPPGPYGYLWAEAI